MEGCRRPVLTRTWVCSFPGWWQRPRRETPWADQPDLPGHTAHCNSSLVCRSRVAGRPSHRPNGPWPPEAEATALTLEEGPDVKVSTFAFRSVPRCLLWWCPPGNHHSERCSAPCPFPPRMECFSARPEWHGPWSNVEVTLTDRWCELNACDLERTAYIRD